MSGSPSRGRELSQGCQVEYPHVLLPRCLSHCAHPVSLPARLSGPGPYPTQAVTDAGPVEAGTLPVELLCGLWERKRCVPGGPACTSQASGPGTGSRAHVGCRALIYMPCIPCSFTALLAPVGGATDITFHSTYHLLPPSAQRIRSPRGPDETQGLSVLAGMF